MLFTFTPAVFLALAASNVTAVAPPTIPELAISAGRFDTLVAAVGAADLGGALSSEGPFTVFAPTDAAFSRVDGETLQFLLTAEGKPELIRILKHHVVPGRLDAATLLGRDEVETLAGTTLALETGRDRLFVGDAVVETADLAASNGIVHVIDRVLLPPKQVSPREMLLTAAIERGVPLFNDDNPEGCCAVYATALDAIRLSADFGLNESGRKALGTRIETAAADTDARSRAWAYRRIIDQLFANRAMTAAPADSTPARAATTGLQLYGFDDSSEVRNWRTVLDGVMGGKSTGRIRSGDGTLVFDGETSLRNNGGFSSMRAQVAAGAIEGYDALRIRLKGDGRNWIVGGRSSSNMGADSYWTRFDTIDGEWMEITVPILEMERHVFGRKIPGQLSPNRMRGIDFYIYDKEEGPFRLEIDSIEAVKTGDSGRVFDA